MWLACQEIFVGALIPDVHQASAVLPCRDFAAEVRILEGVILYLHSETFDRRIQARLLGHSPALEHAIRLQTKIIVQP